MDFPCAVADDAPRVAPPASSAATASTEMIRVSVFIASPSYRSWLDELADDGRQHVLGLAALVVCGLAALAVRHHGERQVGTALQPRLRERGVLEVVPDDRHRVDASMLQR